MYSDALCGLCIPAPAHAIVANKISRKRRVACSPSPQSAPAKDINAMCMVGKLDAIEPL